MEDQTSSEILRREIVTQSEAEAADILKQAQVEVSRILNDAEKEAEKYTADVIRKADSAAEGIQRRILSGVHLEVKKRKLRSRETIIRQLFQQLNQRLETFRHDSAYLNVLEQLVIEGVLAVNDDSLHLECGDVEAKLLSPQMLQSITEKVQKETGRTIAITVSPQTGRDGGVVVAAKNGRTRFDNRFSARIKRNLDVLRLKVVQAVFENEE